MKRSQRGAARVNVIWVVAFGVLFLVGIAFAFVSAQQTADAKLAAEKARATADAAEQSARDARAELIEVSKAVGWFDPAGSAPRTDLTAMQASFSDLKAAIPDMGPDVTNVAAAFPVFKGAYDAKVREIATLVDAKTKLEGEKRALEDSLREALRQNETELAKDRKSVV